MTEQERQDHLRIAALQQAVQMAVSSPPIAADKVVEAAAAFFAFLCPTKSE